MYEPSDFQLPMLRYLRENDYAAFFASMGSRKTATTLYHSVMMDYKVLVICLKSNIKTWCDELEKYFPTETYTPIFGTSDKKIKLLEEDTRFHIVNYDGVKRTGKLKSNRSVYDAFRTKADRYDLVIMDECYEVSNHKSARFKDIRRVIEDIPRRIIMDGEPTAEGIQKLFGQFLMVDGGMTFGRDWYAFMRKYFYQPTNLPFPKWVERPSASKVINKLLRTRAFVFTEDDLRNTAGLPDKLAYAIETKMKPKQKKMYTEIKKEWRIGDLDLKYTMEQISKGRQLLDGFIYMEDEVMRIPSEKEAVLERLLETKLKHKKKIVIFGAFRESLKIIAEVCDKLGRGSVLYYGGLSMSEQTYALEAFKDDAEIEVFICQGSCGVGLNELVVSNVAIYYSNTDKRRDRAQSEKRVERPTQKADLVYVFDLVTPKSYDSIIYKRLQDKRSRSMMLLRPKDVYHGT